MKNILNLKMGNIGTKCTNIHYNNGISSGGDYNEHVWGEILPINVGDTITHSSIGIGEKGNVVTKCKVTKVDYTIWGGELEKHIEKIVEVEIDE